MTVCKAAILPVKTDDRLVLDPSTSYFGLKPHLLCIAFLGDMAQTSAFANEQPELSSIFKIICSITEFWYLTLLLDHRESGVVAYRSILFPSSSETYLNNSTRCWILSHYLIESLRDYQMQTNISGYCQH